MTDTTIIRPEKLEHLVPQERNARTHSRKQLKQIAESIKKFGFTNPVLADGQNGIIAGHGRLEAAKLLGLMRIPVLRLEHMTEAEKRAYVIADNRLAELAGWDNELLALELGAIHELDKEFELALTGFDTAEVEALLNSLDAEPAPEQPAQIDESAPVISRVGDKWILGDHAIICGDATDPAVYSKLLGTEKAQMVFTDPPYNVPVGGHICGLGKVQHEEFVMASEEMSQEEFTAFLTSVTANLARFSSDGSIHYVCMDWRHMQELLTAGAASYTELKNLVFVFKHGTGQVGQSQRAA
ncbi:hypothetical protein GRI38_10520 [Altererythrobacter aurantiacus]|uniref:ParB-like N-terminal domain-containing protein n=1 Tax=Parapontixanthobacter aurantiacus TaxID=1463599 RepID=A0A844ZFA7_9SPHN|nr:ParB/Srx family N-terminal domain-containing protein [Parapontixanthobacter aurantiacus]MXO86458.1 hypothetical protein [Parapontixanthobacter aurantiacus]